MLFRDPAAAIANLALALRPGGRLVLLVWQARARNEWVMACPARRDRSHWVIRTASAACSAARTRSCTA